MIRVLNIGRWEWFKLQRRRMPWILLAILVGISQLAIWGGFVSYTFNSTSGGRVMLPFDATNRGAPRMLACQALQSDPAATVPAGTSQQTIDALLRQCQGKRLVAAARYQALAPRGTIASALSTASVLGLILLGVLSAATIGTEYGLGTLRPILARGTGRLTYLAGKYLMLVAVSTVALLAVCAAAAGSGALAFRIAPAPPADLALAALAAGASSSVWISFAKTWAALVAFVTMAGSITLLVRSTAVGMAISLGYYIVEGILIRLLTAAFEWFDNVADYLPMRNISALTSARANLPAALDAGNGISTLHASLVVASYAIAFIVIAAIVFRRRDVVGAAGG